MFLQAHCFVIYFSLFHKKKEKKRQNLEMFFWLNLNEMRENEQKKTL
jgi:hypothetical protein